MMHKYKSIRTQERLAKITIPEPEYEYDNIDQIDQKFEELCDTETEVNAAVIHSGSVVIQTALSSLMMGQNNRLSVQISKIFDLNPTLLLQCKTEQEKKECVRDQLNQVIHSLLKNWQDKLFLKEQKYKQSDQAHRKEKQVTHKQKHFKWLKLRTKYEQLKNKLRQIVVDKLNDYENQEMAVKNRNSTLMLKNVQIVTTRNIFEHMEKYSNSNEFHFLKSLGQERLNKIKDRANRMSCDQSKDMSPDQPQYDVTWDQSKEQVFSEQRNHTKQLFNNEVSCSNWNDLGFLPLLQQMNLQQKKKTQREHILNKYTEGQGLTAQELQFLANTSELLNACLDKEFFQRATNQIDRNLMSNMELNLAESILGEYYEMKDSMMRARLNFIKNKIKKTKDQLVIKVANEGKEAEMEYYKEMNRKYIRMYTTVINHMDRLNKFEEKVPEDIPGALLLKEYLYGRINEKQYITRIKQSVSDRNKRRQERMEFGSDSQLLSDSQVLSKQPQKTIPKGVSQKRQLAYAQSISRPKSSVGLAFITDCKRHIYHPSSKLVVTKKNENDEDVGFLNEARTKFNEAQVDKFKLALKSHPALRRGGNFVKFYSGGPIVQENFRMLNLGNSQPTQREINAAIVIQRKLRSLFRERRLHQKVDNRRKQIYYFYKQSCENIINQVTLERTDPTLQYFAIQKQLERCKEFSKEQLNYGKHPKVEDAIPSKRATRTQTSLYSTDMSSPKSVQIFKFCNLKNKPKINHLFNAASKSRVMMMLQTHFVYSANDINSQNEQGDTALHIVVSKGNQDFAEWLLNNGGNPYIPNALSLTAWDIANQMNKCNIIRLIKMYSNV